ncbi:MAG: MerR family transcriptional regulator [Anaerolineae bacterium]
MNNRYTIRQTEENTGVSAHTLRYYERIGLIKNIERNTSGHRQYTDKDLNWVTLLSCLRSTGMSIQQMQAFLALIDEGDHTIPERCEMFETHHSALCSHIEELQGYLKVIEGKLFHYRKRSKEFVISTENRT